MPRGHLTLPVLTPQQIARFWAKVQKGQPDQCWPWMGCRQAAGYGRVGINGKVWQAPRIAYLLAHGAFPSELCVMHTCDNPPCCNPRDLCLGTDADNSRDKAQKGRSPRTGFKGEANTHAKLTAQDVVCIRQQYASPGLTQRGLAAEYGVTRATIGDIVRRKTWRHIR